MEKENKKKMAKWKIALIVVASVLAVVTAGGVIAVNVLLDRIDYTFDDGEPTIFQEDDITPEPEDSEPAETATAPGATARPDKASEPVYNEPPVSDKNILNVLLIGMDRRSPRENGRSDTMIIATFDKKNKKLKMTSIMRDTYVYIPGNYRDNRINASFAFGNAPLLMKTINTNFNLKIDKFIAVDFDMFTKIIQRIGNIDMYLTKAEAQRLMGEGSPAGNYSLDPGLTLGYTRLRKIDSDFQRTSRQRKVLTALYSKGIKTDIFTLTGMLYDILPYVKTNLTKSELLSIMSDVYSLGKSNIEELRIPCDGAFQRADIRGMSVLVPDLRANAEKIRKFIYG